MSSLKKFRDKKKGFTLIELIVVIAIIGILAAVLLPRFGGFTDSAREKSAKSEAKSVYTAMESYYAENGKYTKSATDLKDIKKEIADKITFKGSESDPSFEYKYDDKITITCDKDGKLKGPSDTAAGGSGTGGGN